MSEEVSVQTDKTLSGCDSWRQQNKSVLEENKHKRVELISVDFRWLRLNKLPKVHLQLIDRNKQRPDDIYYMQQTSITFWGLFFKKSPFLPYLKFLLPCLSIKLTNDKSINNPSNKLPAEVRVTKLIWPIYTDHPLFHLLLHFQQTGIRKYVGHINEKQVQQNFCKHFLNNQIFAFKISGELERVFFTRN